MLYIGHFSFDEVGPENKDRHGYFTCTAEAEDVDGATEIFKAYIVSLKETVAFFQDVVAVYIEDIVEILKVPARPVLIQFQSSEGRFPKSVSRPLPVIDHPDIQVYGLAADVNRIEKKGTAPYTEATAFIEFIPNRQE